MDLSVKRIEMSESDVTKILKRIIDEIGADNAQYLIDSFITHDKLIKDVEDKIATLKARDKHEEDRDE